MAEPKYKRILLKISGEALLGRQRYNIDVDVVKQIASEIADAHALGVEIAVVVGGGNIFRGAAAAALGIDRVTGDSMGMLATVINALALQSAVEEQDIQTRVQSAIEMRQVAEPYIKRKAVRHLEKGRVVIFAAGTGNPFFSTDTAAALRANEIGAEIILKATKVEGVYDSDPELNNEAKMYRELSYQDILTQELRVMDSTAASLCRDNNMPIVVFNLAAKGNIRRVILGEPVGTVVS